jgi:hypothetical protein
MVTAVVVLMLITSMGIFGFLSKAHNDQTLVSGDVGSKIAIYDEKIKTTKENIEADRKQLKQMDEAVDQIMGRSSDEKGADKANAVRKSQQRDRISLAKDIETQQKLIASLNDEAAPIRAEVRKVEAEVGPIKYIAAFIYGTSPDESMLERAVTWIIILIVIVFDPLAVIMLLAAQMTFGWKKETEDPLEEIPVVSTQADEILKQGVTNSNPADNTPLTTDFEGVRDPGGEWIQTGPAFEVSKKQDIEYQFIEEFHEPEHTTPATALGGDITAPEELTADSTESVSELDKWNRMIEEAEREASKANESSIEERLATGETYINSEGIESPSVLSGTAFPENPGKGDEFLRVDYSPEKTFKFDGAQWVGVDDQEDQKKRLT